MKEGNKELKRGGEGGVNKWQGTDEKRRWRR